MRLGWIWPGGATDALVRWPGGERRCSRRVYDDEGGAVITVGAAETTIEVRAVYPQRDGSLTAPGTRVRVPARGVAVSYRIRASRWHPRQRTIEFTAERAIRLPALVVVRSTGRYAPDDPSEGETVARVGPQDIAPGRPRPSRSRWRRDRPGWPVSSTRIPLRRTRGACCCSPRPRRR